MTGPGFKVETFVSETLDDLKFIMTLGFIVFLGSGLQAILP